MAEPDPDRRDVDGSAPDEVAFVIPGSNGPVLAELAEGALDGVALLIGGRVEGSRPPALAAAPEPVAGLVSGFGDSRFDAASAQVNADRAAGVRLVAQDPPRPGPGTAGPAPRDLQPVHQRDEGQGIMTLPGTGHPGQRPAARISEQVNLGGQPA